MTSTGESFDDSQGEASDHVAESKEADHAGPVEPMEPRSLQDGLDTMEYELNQIVDSLVENLPENPVPGPPVPQFLGMSTKSSEDGTAKVAAPVPPPPVPTPCRTDTRAPSQRQTHKDWFAQKSDAM